MAGRHKMRTKWARNQTLLNDDNFWVLVFELIERGQNLPAISKAVDVPYSSMSKFINDHEVLKASFHKAKLNQEENIIIFLQKKLNSLREHKYK